MTPRPPFPEAGGQKRDKDLEPRVLGLASLCGEEQPVDSPQRANAFSLPLNARRPQNCLLPGHLLSGSEAVFSKAGGMSSLPFTHLATWDSATA